MLLVLVSTGQNTGMETTEWKDIEGVHNFSKNLKATTKFRRQEGGESHIDHPKYFVPPAKMYLPLRPGAHDLYIRIHIYKEM